MSATDTGGGLGGLKDFLSSAAARAAPALQGLIRRLQTAAGDDRFLADAGAARTVNIEERTVKALCESDPDFSVDEFKNRARTAFLKLVKAETEKDLKGVRPFISDGLHERLLLQLRERQERGLTGRLVGVDIGHVAIADAELGVAFQTVAVRIEATVTEQQAAAGREGTVSRHVAEYWSFLRSTGVKSRPGKPGLIEGSCPNCGAGVEMSQHDICPSCRSLLRSGRHDWVLAEIVQEPSWSPPRLFPIRGLKKLQTEDPAFSVQQAEDRASVLFWRWQQARRLSSVEGLLPVSTPAMLEAFSAELAAENAGSPRTWAEDCSVGDVELRGAVRRGAVWKLAVIVEWSGQIVAVRDGRPCPEMRQCCTRSVMVLVRNAGVRSDPDRALSSAHCPGCGAPELGLSGSCDYCGAQLNATSSGWMLEAIHRCSSTEGQMAMKELIPPSQSAPRRGLTAAGLIAWLVKTAAADGRISLEEESGLRAMASARGVGRVEVEGMISAATTGNLETPVPGDRAEAMEWLRSLISASLADGELSMAEVSTMCSLAEKSGISEQDVLALASSELTEAVRRAESEMDAAQRAGVAERVAAECRRRREARRFKFD